MSELNDTYKLVCNHLHKKTCQTIVKHLSSTFEAINEAHYFDAYYNLAKFIAITFPLKIRKKKYMYMETRCSRYSNAMASVQYKSIHSS